MKELKNLFIRIKTKKEFINEFGVNWPDKVKGAWIIPEMNIFYNFIVPKEYKLECFKVICNVSEYVVISHPKAGSWHFSIDMMKYEYKK